jgi:hypothetical protein
MGRKYRKKFVGNPRNEKTLSSERGAAERATLILVLLNSSAKPKNGYACTSGRAIVNGIANPVC